MLDTEMNGWKSLAPHFEITHETTVQFGLPGPGPTAELFFYMSTTDGLKDLTVGELRKHFEAMKQKKLVNILPKDKGLCFSSHIINLSRLWSCVLGFSSVLTFFYFIHVQLALIFVDPLFHIGTVHVHVFVYQWYAGHPRRPRGSQSGREKRRDKIFQAQVEQPLGTDSHRTISKRSSECWLLIEHKKFFILLCPIGEQHLLSSFREFVHDGYWLDHGLSGSCTKETHAVRNLSGWYKRYISKHW